MALTASLPPARRTLVALLTLALLAPVLAPPAWALRGAPLPAGWVADDPPPSRHGQANAPATTEPLWGVPAFEPPTARDCRGPLQVRQTPSQPPVPPQSLGRHRETGDPRDAAAPLESRAERSARADAPATPAPAPAPAAATALAPRSEAKRALAMPHASGSLAATVTAGLVDDNADFGEYLVFLRRSAALNPRQRDASERYRVELKDAAGRPVADAEVALSWPGAREALLFARTDAAGQVWLLPRLLLAPDTLAGLDRLELQARAPNGEVTRTLLQRGQKAAAQLQLRSTAAAAARVPLDLVFLVDATGSMGDEIAKLRDSLRSIADRVGALPTRPDVCWGLVAYRDLGDAFTTRTQDLTADLGTFQRTLGALQAGGGGDYPEALQEALDETVHRIAWRGAGTTRLVVLLGDAPPHLDRGGPYFDQAAAAALARGIKLHAVGASGLDAQGEVVFRQLAQSTGGRFVFLTYRDARDPGSGPGRETVHDVRDYSVATLDALIVRLVRDELAARSAR